MNKNKANGKTRIAPRQKIGLPATKIGSKPRQKLLDKAATMSKPTLAEKIAGKKITIPDKAPTEGYVVLLGSKCRKCGNKLSTFAGWSRCSYVKCDLHNKPWKGIGNPAEAIGAPSLVKGNGKTKTEKPEPKQKVKKVEKIPLDLSFKASIVEIMQVVISDMRTMEAIRYMWLDRPRGDEDVVITPEQLKTEQWPADIAELAINVNGKCPKGCKEIIFVQEILEGKGKKIK